MSMVGRHLVGILRVITYNTRITDKLYRIVQIDRDWMNYYLGFLTSA